MLLWSVLRFVFVFIYLGGFIALRLYLGKHPPEQKGLPFPETQPMNAIQWMWLPLLWFLPGLIWLGFPAFPDSGTIIALNILIPSSIFLLFLVGVGIFPKNLRSQKFAETSAYGFFAVALIILATVARAAISHSSGVALLLFFIFITVPPGVAVLLVCLVAQEIIPLDFGQEHRWATALQIFTAFFTGIPKPAWVIEDGKVEGRIKGNSYLGFGPGWLMTEPENVVVLQGGTDIKRVVGPGVVLTGGAESPFRVIDLRNQIRSDKVEGITQDGIQIRLPITSLFCIKPGEKTIDLNSLKRHEPWPYQKQAVYRAIFDVEVDPAGKTPLEAHKALSWDEIPLKVAMNRLKQVVSLYNFDQLYGVDQDANTLTRLVIGKTVRETVARTVEPMGYKILGGGVGGPIMPVDEDVANKQVDKWQIRWMNKTLDWQAETKIKQLKALNDVRSQARVQLFTTLLEDVLDKYQNVAGSNDVIALDLLESLLHIARSPEVKDGIPESQLSTLFYLQQQARERPVP